MTLSTRTCTNECAARTQHLNLIVLIFIINMRTYFIHIFFIVSFHFVWWLIARRSRSYINHVDFYICVLCSVVQWLMVGNDYEKRPTKLTRPLICSDILKFQQCPLAECHSIQPYSHCLDVLDCLVGVCWSTRRKVLISSRKYLYINMRLTVDKYTQSKYNIPLTLDAIEMVLCLSQMPFAQTPYYILAKAENQTAKHTECQQFDCVAQLWRIFGCDMGLGLTEY